VQLSFEKLLAAAELTGNTKPRAVGPAAVRNMFSETQPLFAQAMAYVFDPHQSGHWWTKDQALLISIKLERSIPVLAMRNIGKAANAPDRRIP
jgi:hypothetical protein